MNKIRVGLNGLGRIGRHIYRMCINDASIELVGINEINPDLDNWAYTLNYDSIYGQAKHKTKVENGKIICNKKSIFTSIQKDIAKVPWDEWGVEFIIDSSGILENTINSKKINGKSQKKIIFTNSPEEVDFTLILGVNEKKFDPKNHHFIASSICDATAIAPVTKIIDDLYKINL